MFLSEPTWAYRGSKLWYVIRINGHFLVGSLQLFQNSTNRGYRNLTNEKTTQNELCILSLFLNIMVFIPTRPRTLRTKMESWLRLWMKKRTAEDGRGWSSRSIRERNPMAICSNFQGLQHKQESSIYQPYIHNMHANYTHAWTYVFRL